MATPQINQKSDLQYRISDTSRSQEGVNKLFEAAVINQQFRKLLLEYPEQALQQGYKGQSIDLSPEERALISSIGAKSLSELAQQVTKVLN
ncbi:MAG: hypothetical protein QGM50_07640 [Anaerolineae bacterium]|nr:hypothetical protein [Anaerolineae bacterium]MDK1081266.1 hypothetical protein [Anaerolineae bacterium]MDK1118650.1 hypothetical protein [Anaerolineae bacterium]